LSPRLTAAMRLNPLLAATSFLISPMRPAIFFQRGAPLNLMATELQPPTTVARPITPQHRSAAPPPPPPTCSDGSLKMQVLKPSKIRRGDFVVHSKFGVGRFEGVYLYNDDKYLKVQFRDTVLEMLPEQRGLLKLFKRREQHDALTPIRLDSTRSRKSWERRKAKATKNVLAVGADLLKMYALRQNLTRPACTVDGQRFHAFEQAFPYRPTPDQLACFDDIKRDMTQTDRPMDRLVCGDVGFGKTEAAMRAVHRAVCNGRQVAVLAPTTVLAAQHLRVLRERMPDLRVEMLSGLTKRTAMQKAELIAEIKAGSIDVLVGTHAVLSDKLQWGRLGLLVVDEEQRFGVRQKEKIKNASLAIDVLALSATPIPRTMYMCMAGIREISILQSPPPGRLPVQTTVLVRDDNEVKLAIERELERGGQVFYVVPRVEMVMREVVFLQQMFPERAVSFAYGGIRDLEERIVEFTLGKVDVMVCTTIMENGIDIPNVNTIITQDSHLFGLSQLHQLRGRVGRSNVQAYALLLHPNIAYLGEDALRRLRVLQRETGLGAGYKIAQGDLQLRGAGNLFGTEQKGAFGINDIGLDMYMEVLQRAMRYLEQKQVELGNESIDYMDLIKGAELDESMLMSLSDSLADR